MASSSWFHSSHRRQSLSSGLQVKQDHDTAVPTTLDDGEATALVRPSLQQATTAPLSTPHDAVLAELTGVLPIRIDANISRGSGDTPSPSAVPLNRSIPAGEDASTQEQESSAQIPQSTAPTPHPIDNPPIDVEKVYDPFTGNLVGVLYPSQSAEHSAFVDSDTAAGKHRDGLEFDLAKDDLWSHLARIRGLQGEIAGMHIHMEGIGTSDGRRGGQKRPPGTASRMHTDTIGAADEWVDAEQEATERERVRDVEFTKLAESFKGRRAAIDGIMGKLDDLSKALGTFHALPTPQIAQLFRNNAKDSSTTSPVLRSPSPMFTNPASSPPPSSPPPISPTSPPPDFGRREKSMLRNMGVVRTDYGIRSETLSPMSESPVSDEGRL